MYPAAAAGRRSARSVPPREDEGRGAGGARKVVPAGPSCFAHAPPGGAGRGGASRCLSSESRRDRQRGRRCGQGGARSCRMRVRDPNPAFPLVPDAPDPAATQPTTIHCLQECLPLPRFLLCFLIPDRNPTAPTPGSHVVPMSVC